MVGIISVTEKGDVLAEKLAQKLISKVYLKSQIIEFKLSEITKDAMKKHKGIIFISSTGIAVRAIAPFLKGKDKDPGVVVVDVSNNYTISLISGHIGGANDLAIDVSQILNNIPIITTATDNIGVTAPDIIAVKNSLVIEDLNKAKMISTLLVNGEVAWFKDDKNLIETPNGYIKTDVIKDNSVWITNRLYVENNIEGKVDSNKILRLIRKDIVLGIGCRKAIESGRLEEFIRMALVEKNIDIKSVLKIGSIDIKKNEKAIIDLSEKLECEFSTFSKGEILKIQHKFEGSDFVEKTLGVRAVSEPCVELMNGKIIEAKIKFNGMTLCIGQV